MEPGNADLPYLLDSSVADFLRLLHAVDTFPRGETLKYLHGHRAITPA